MFDNVAYSGLTVALGIAVALLRKGAASGVQLWFHLAITLALVGLVWVWISVMFEQEEFFINLSQAQFAMAWLAFVLIGYATWHGFGFPMLLVYLAMGAYVLLPMGAGEDWTRVADNLWYSTDGVFGRPVEVVGRVVLIFIVFGAILQTSGAGEVLLKFAFVATGRFAGGPAHAAIVASALFGTLSGAAVANVISTGVFTIPIIKKSGFKAKFAGAVEAAASTGGQIMPPVMGVVAFLMADVTGIPYLKIVVAASIPAAMYYLSLFMVVLIEARKQGIGSVPVEQRQSLTRTDWVKSLAFWVPLGVLIAYLLEGRTPQNAGFAATIVATVLCLVLFPEFRHPRKWLEALIDAGRTAATMMVIVAAIGFIIGVVNMTGIGLRFAEGILAASNSSLIFSLILVMIGCLIMGMGVPTGAAYLIIAIVLGPALERLGLPTIAAHLFVVYFGVLSVVTPPVALAAFAAAPIAGSGPMETGFEASRLAIAGFIIPFLFVYHQDVLIIVDDFSIVGLAWAVIAFTIATWTIATALSGFEARPLSPPQRILRGVVAVLTLFPIWTICLPAAALAVGLLLFHRMSDGGKVQLNSDSF